MKTIHAWVSAPTNGDLIVMLAQAETPDEAIDKIIQKLAKVVFDQERLAETERTLRHSAPQLMDFSGDVGVLT
ncbi:MAG: hypothetical protein ACRD4P_11890, partial [Bryobacteraceae bacterium]